MRRLWAAALLVPAAPAAAGPPFVTDDPVPTDLHQWEIYGYGEGLVLRHGFDGETGFDINYGGFREVQLTATLPYAARADGVTRVALGDVELGAKYRFLHHREGSGAPDIAFFPKLSLPTAGHRGTGRVGAQLPVWAQNDWGDWSLFGGGGYAVNPGTDQRYYAFGGVTLTRTLGERASVGVELFRQGSDTRGGTASTLAGVGATRAVAAHWNLLGAVDRYLDHTDEHGRYRVYLALLFHG